jgi:hypothetical protein
VTAQERVRVRCRHFMVIELLLSFAVLSAKPEHLILR